MIRRATLQDIDRISEIYEAIHSREETGQAQVGWKRGVYPTRETAVSGLNAGDLFVAEDGGKITAAARINRQQLPEYAACPWTLAVPDAQVMVLHTLVVDPEAKGRGYGTEFVKYYEDFARARGCKSLRMDTQEKNAAARAFYRRLGFCEPGTVRCVFNGIPDVKLVCLEKRL